MQWLGIWIWRGQSLISGSHINRCGNIGNGSGVTIDLTLRWMAIKHSRWPGFASVLSEQIKHIAITASAAIHIFDLISAKSFSNLSLSIEEIGHPMPKPSVSFGFGIYKCKGLERRMTSSEIQLTMWKWTWLKSKGVSTTGRRGRTGCTRIKGPSTYVIDLLVSNSSIILKNIIVLSTGCFDKFFHNWLHSAVRFEISKY